MLPITLAFNFIKIMDNIITVYLYYHYCLFFTDTRFVHL